MTRPPVPLSQHLLTRSDLAQLDIPAGRILSWLAKGWLEQVGSLPGADASGDPVFTVSARELRHELAPGLAAIGKANVVFTPLRVRSLLLRAILNDRARPAEPGVVAPSASATAPTDTLAQHLMGTDLATVLQEAAEGLEADVDAVLQMAREEVQLEARELADDDAVAAADAEPAAAVELVPDPAEPIDCFDTAALVQQLDAWHDRTHNAAEAIATPAACEVPAVEATTAAVGPPSIEPVLVPAPSRSEAEAMSITMTKEAHMDPLQVAAVSTAPEDAATDPAATRSSDEAGAGREATLPHAAADTQPGAKSSFDEANLTTQMATELVEKLTHDPTAEAMVRVESFLTELRQSLLEVAQRPTAPPIDVQPLVAAVHTGFRQSTEQGAATMSALTVLTNTVAEIGHRVDARLAEHRSVPIPPMVSPAAAAPAAAARTTYPVIEAAGRTHLAVIAVGFLVLCWSGVFWWKTGNSQLALGTLVGANLVGCCLLLGRRLPA